MDKRIFFFILAIVVIFYLVHQWFEEKLEKPASTTVARMETTIKFSGKGKAAPLSEKEMEEFHVEKLFSDINFQNFLTYAISGQNNYLTLASENLSYPEVAYVQRSVENISFPSRVELRVAPKQIGDPVLYSISPSIKLKTPWLPLSGNYPVFLIYFEKGKPYKINGEAFGFSNLVLEQIPPQNGITIFDFKNDLKPSAIYYADKKIVEYLDWIKDLQDYSVLVYPEDPLEKERKDQKYYVLENEFMQLVFTNYNGSLAEINLPFQSKENPDSIVRKIDFDRIIEANYPNNANFPQFSYFVPDGNKELKQKQPQKGGYYPLLRRNIIGLNEITTTWINPHFYATTLFENNEAPHIDLFKVKRFEKNLIEFEYKTEKGSITKTFSFPADEKDAPYVLDFSIDIEGDINPPLYLQVGIPEVELIFGNSNPSLKYRSQKKENWTVNEMQLPKGQFFFGDLQADWYSSGNGFFGIIVDPLNRKADLEVMPVSGEVTPSRISIIDSQFQLYPAGKYPGYAMHIPVDTKGITKYRMFAGPFAKAILNRVDQTYTDHVTGYTPDYIKTQSFYGWFATFSLPFTQLLFLILNFFNGLTHSWGISIILLPIAIAIMLYPINNKLMKSIAKLQTLSPKIQEIQEKYKTDPKLAEQEIDTLYKREEANPFARYLILLIQLPFLFGMFYLLKSTFSLRGASFIPGWIDNLSSPDLLFRLDYPIPLIGTSFHLLPILLGVLMYFQQRPSVTTTTHRPLTVQQRRPWMIGSTIAIVFTVIFYPFPSGLNIYWISALLLALLQQWKINKQMGITSRTHRS